MKDKFKEFVKTKPELIDYIKNKEMTWQDFYEIYNLYGDDENVWNKYRKSKENISKITDLLKNTDLDSIKEHINTAQKALDLVQELTSKDSSVSNVATSIRPINKFFED